MGATVMWYFKLPVFIPCFSKPCLKLLICEEVKSKGRLRRERHIVCTCFFCSTMFYPHSYVSELCEKTHIFFARIVMPAKKPHVDTATLTKKSFMGWPLGVWRSCTTMQAEKLLLSTYSASKEKDPAVTEKSVYIFAYLHLQYKSCILVRKFNHSRRNNCGCFKPLWVIL